MHPNYSILFQNAATEPVDLRRPVGKRLYISSISAVDLVVPCGYVYHPRPSRARCL